MQKLSRINREEREILDRAKRGDIDPFTDYFLRSKTSGTWWFPGAHTERWARGYTRLLRSWKAQKRPDRFMFDDKNYTVVYEHEKSLEFPDHPAFHHNHGFLLLPFGKELHVDRTPIRTIIGGFGSGKTMNQAVSLLIHAATLPGYRAFGLAPEAKQANEVLKIAYAVMRGTLFEERFLVRYTREPNAYMLIGSDYTLGENSIECYPILKKEESLRTLTGDMAVIDQAERFDDLEGVIRDVGTRFRGRVVETGRSRIGTLTLIANADFNDSLWRVYEKAEDEPTMYKAISPSTYDNPYLTDADIVRYEAQVGGDDEGKRVYLLGGRPLGDGKEFSRSILLDMKDDGLDAEMQLGIDGNLPGYVKNVYKRVGCVEWLLPYKEGHHYCVISDPGTDSPPNRNAFAILVWDVTKFPGKTGAYEPATLAGYVWGSGRGDIKNWANKHAELVWRYKAVGLNAFDATGQQSGYDQWMMILNNLVSEKINLGGNNKAHCLNSAKMLTAERLMKIPAGVEPLFSQLQRYEIPEPPKLKQDLVMAFIMSAFWLKRLFYMILDRKSAPTEHGIFDDRYDRPLEERDEFTVVERT